VRGYECLSLHREEIFFEVEKIIDVTFGSDRKLGTKYI